MYAEKKRKADGSGEPEKRQRTDSDGNGPAAKTMTEGEPKKASEPGKMVESPMEGQVQTAGSNNFHQANKTQTNEIKELPNELWASVVGKLERVEDFARVQRVSHAFCGLVLEKCWTKVTKIHISGHFSGRDDVGEWVTVTMDTGVPGQERKIRVDMDWLLLGKLAKKATKTTILSLDLDWLRYEGHAEILCRFLDAAIMAKIKVEQLEVRGFHPTKFPLIPRALARFLNASVKSLKRLSVETSSYEEESLPAELLQALQSCRALESAKTTAPGRALMGSVLHQKDHLESFDFNNGNADPSVLLESGTKLRRLCCPSDFLEDYLKEVQRQSRSQDHPLHFMEELKIRCCPDGVPTIPRALLPNLSRLDAERSFAFDDDDWLNVAQVVRGFLTHWAPRVQQSTLKCRIDCWESFRNIGHGDLNAMSKYVVSACGCQVTICSPHRLVCSKGNATVHVSLHHHER